MTTKLQQCACGGFLPPGRSTCPHCGLTVAAAPTTAARVRNVARRLRLATLGGALGGATIAFTLMACYGGAVCPDGTADCVKTPPAPSGSSVPEAGPTTK